MSEAVHWPFKVMHGFLAALSLTQTDEVLSYFHSQMLCGLLFSSLVLWAWEFSLELEPLASQRRPL